MTSITSLARVRALATEGPRYWRLDLDAPPEANASFARPGQYTTLGVGVLAPRFVVIASTPAESHDTGVWSFLIERTTNLGQALSQASVGDTITLGPAQGAGFSLPNEGPIAGFVTGSGLATLRPVWRGLTEPERLHLFYGEARPEDFALSEELGRLERAGARIERVWSERDRGPRFVQEVFLARPLVLDGGRALLSGSEPMMRAVREVLLASGVPSGHILTNV